MLIFGMYINEHMFPNTFSQIRAILVLINFLYGINIAARPGRALWPETKIRVQQ